MNFCAAGCRKVWTFQSTPREKAQKFTAVGLVRSTPLRLIIPKDARETLGLQLGDSIKIIVENDSVIVKKAD